MNEKEFLLALKRTKRQYYWSLDSRGNIRARARNHFVGDVKDNCFCPITAVGRFNRKGTVPISIPGQVGFKLGICLNMEDSIVRGADMDSNRGHAQVIRGRMRRVLGI